MKFFYIIFVLFKSEVTSIAKKIFKFSSENPIGSSQVALLKIYHRLGFPALTFLFSLSRPADLGVRITDL